MAIMIAEIRLPVTIYCGFCGDAVPPTLLRNRGSGYHRGSYLYDLATASFTFRTHLKADPFSRDTRHVDGGPGTYPPALRVLVDTD